MREILYLWDTIESYPDKTEHIIDIIYHAELAYTLAIDAAIQSGKKDKEELYSEKLKKLKGHKEITDFEMDLFELDDLYKELKNRLWRDKITFDDKNIDKPKIREYFMDLYNNIRYDLLTSVYKDYKIGDSGKIANEETEAVIRDS